MTYNPRVKIVAVHPCRIPEGEEGYTGQDCPEPDDAVMEDAGAGDDEEREESSEPTEAPPGT